MLTKTGHIEYWLTSSEDDWQTAMALFEAKRFLHALFFAHLSIEKLCKALWVQNNQDNFPPRIHHLVKLIQQAQIEMNEEWLIYLQSFNHFQIEGRYPDYLFKINKVCTFEFTKDTLDKVLEIKLWLRSKMQ